LIIFLLFTACSRQTQPDGLLIAVSIPPQTWFVSQIAGEKAVCMALVEPGQNPHNYEPGPKQIRALASARAWVLSGTEFEISLRPKTAALFPNLLIVDGTEGVRFRTLEEHDDFVIHDGVIPDDDGVVHDGEHSSLAVDRHTWLGREPAKILAAHIRDTLCAVDGANEAYYVEQCELLVRLIDEEFDKLKIELAPLEGKSVFVYHPSFGYFLDEFGITQVAVETGGKEPGPRELGNLIAKMKEERPSAIFVQSQFPVNAAKTVASAVGAQVIALDHLAPDWLENIRFMGQILKSAAMIEGDSGSQTSGSQAGAAP
jgi:zinc transport system substrate-binding protein